MTAISTQGFGRTMLFRPDLLQDLSTLVISVGGMLGIGRVWQEMVRNRGKAATRQSDELSAVRHELREDIATVRAELRAGKEQIERLTNANVEVRREIGQILLSSWVFREKVRILIMHFRTNNPGWQDLASDIERDDHGLDGLMDRYDIRVHRMADLQPALDMHMRHTEPSGSMPEEDFSECRVLIADDWPDTINLFNMALKSESYELLTAESGGEALEKYHDSIRDGRPLDFLILDQNMPGLSGTDVARVIRDGGDNRIGIVFLTAYPEAFSIGSAEIVGADSVWYKPVPIDSLKLKIRGALASVRLKNKERATS